MNKTLIALLFISLAVLPSPVLSFEGSCLTIAFGFLKRNCYHGDKVGCDEVEEKSGGITKMNKTLIALLFISLAVLPSPVLSFEGSCLTIAFGFLKRNCYHGDKVGCDEVEEKSGGIAVGEYEADKTCDDRGKPIAGTCTFTDGDVVKCFPSDEQFCTDTKTERPDATFDSSTPYVCPAPETTTYAKTTTNDATTTSDPVDPITSDPVDPITSDPVDPITSDPVDPITSDPVDPITSDPVDPITSDPVDPITSDPVDPSTYDPVDPTDDGTEIEETTEQSDEEGSCLIAIEGTPFGCFVTPIVYCDQIHDMDPTATGIFNLSSCASRGFPVQGICEFDGRCHVSDQNFCYGVGFVFDFNFTVGVYSCGDDEETEEEVVFDMDAEESEEFTVVEEDEHADHDHADHGHDDDEEEEDETIEESGEGSNEGVSGAIAVTIAVLSCLVIIL
eukprot:TRINITY_DN157_c0_g1_i1.p1 TRINITY_DN157_c0_g1~~TRINITY_DN157_c0_g1_i1.p1  ORF type:complete len:458 (+),score=168.31 TRINITY_DN157_c0_g1_i1:34-1374(+)